MTHKPIRSRTRVRPTKDQIFLLRQYDGALTWLVLALGALLAIGTACVPLGLLAAGVFVVHIAWLQYLVGVASLVTAGLPTWARRSRLWTAPLRARLNRWTQYHPEVATVSVLTKPDDAAAIARTIRTAGLPIVHQRTFGQVHDDDDPRNSQIVVAQSCHRPVMSDDVFRGELLSALAPTGLWTNVGGIEMGVRTPETPTPAVAVLPGAPS